MILAVAFLLFIRCEYPTCQDSGSRGIKTIDSPVIAGFQIFHNYFREHEGLDGKTPAEAAEIKTEGVNPWITVIQNARKHKNMTQ
jgi:hypothetical protein